MAWLIQNHDGALLVTMNTSSVNKQNEAFFADLHTCFDVLDREHPMVPIVLTGQGHVFSAGLDFEEVFNFFEGATVAETSAWFLRFYKTISRVLTAERMVVGAINGHAYAGGAVLALTCDHRIGPLEGARASINEVPIGIPMPCPYVELARSRMGDREAQEWILFGREHSPSEALASGFFHQLAPNDKLLDVALAKARSLSPLARTAYVASKKTLLLPLLERIERLTPKTEQFVLPALLSEDGKRSRALIKATLAAKKR